MPNEIYDFMQQNNLTDKSEGQFLKEYSDPNKASEIFNFFKENKLTDKDSATFYDTYLKKKDGTQSLPSGGSQNPPLQSPAQSQSGGVVPKAINFDEMFPKQVTAMGGKINLPTQEPKESTSQVYNKDVQNKQQAISNREANIKKIDIAKNDHAIKVLASKGIKTPTKQDIDFQKNFTDKQIDNGDLVLAKNNDGSYALKGGTGLVQSFTNALNQNDLRHKQEEYQNSLSKEEKIKYLNEHPDGVDTDFELNSDQAPSGMTGALGKMAGDNIPFLAKITAGAMGGEALQGAGLVGNGASAVGQFLAQAGESLHSSMANTTAQTYHQLKQQNPNIPDHVALDKAENAALASGTVSLGTSAFFSKVGGDNIIPVMQEASSGVVNALKAHAKQVLKSYPEVVAAFSGGQVATDLAKKSQGVNVSFGEGLKNATDAGIQATQMHLGMALLGASGIVSKEIPGFLKAQLINYVASAPRDKVINDLSKLENDGVIPQGGAAVAAEKLAKWDEKKEITNDMDLPEEHKAAITGKLMQNDKIDAAIKKYNENKEAFAPQIAKLEEAKKANNEVIKNMQTADSPLEHEVDSTTGEPVISSPQNKSENGKSNEAENATNQGQGQMLDNQEGAVNDAAPIDKTPLSESDKSNIKDAIKNDRGASTRTGHEGNVEKSVISVGDNEINYNQSELNELNDIYKKLPTKVENDTDVNWTERRPLLVELKKKVLQRFLDENEAKSEPIATEGTEQQPTETKTVEVSKNEISNSNDTKKPNNLTPISNDGTLTSEDFWNKAAKRGLDDGNKVQDEINKVWAKKHKELQDIKATDKFLKNDKAYQELLAEREKHNKWRDDHYHAIEIRDSLKNGFYDKAISKGEITPEDAKTIIESAGLEVPKNILDLVNGEIPKAETTNIVSNENANIAPNDVMKQKQLDIINKSNPAPNDYNAWIRKVEDIKTADEVFGKAFEDGAMYPDFSENEMKKSLKSGDVTIYSSKPIEDGVFVTPSKMNAVEYAGGKGKKIYSKKVKIEDIAWIDESEGQFAPVPKEPKAEPITPASKEVENEPAYISQNGKYHIIDTPHGKKVVDAKTGADVSNRVAKKYLDESIDNYNFDTGKRAEIADDVEFDTQQDYIEHVIGHSTSPVEIAQIYALELPEKRSLSDEQLAIAEEGIGYTTNRSYREHGDKNNMSLGKAKAYINNAKGVPLDVIAKEISDHRGIEITPQDLVDFMDRFPQGEVQALKEFESENAENAKDRFRKLTGYELNSNTAEKALESEFKTYSENVKDLAEHNFNNEQELKNDYEYWEHYDRTFKGSEDGSNNETSSTEKRNVSKDIPTPSKTTEGKDATRSDAEGKATENAKGEDAPNTADKSGSTTRGTESTNGKSDGKQSGQSGRESVEVKHYTKVVDDATEELRIANESFKSKKKDLDNEIADNQTDLFGQKKADLESGPKLFDTDIDVKAKDAALKPLKDRVENAKKALSDAQDKLEQAKTKETAQTSIDFENQKNVEKFGFNDTPKSFNDKVDETVDKLINLLSAKNMKGVHKAGVGAEEVLKAAGKLIKTAYHAGENIRDAVEKAIDYIKDKFPLSNSEENTIRYEFNRKADALENMRHIKSVESMLGDGRTDEHILLHLERKGIPKYNALAILGDAKTNMLNPDVRADNLDKSVTEYNKNIEDRWIGEKDLNDLKSKITARDQQAAIQKSVKPSLFSKKNRSLFEKASAEKDPIEKQKLLNAYKASKDWRNVDKAIHIFLDTKRNNEHFEEYYPKLTDAQKAIADLSQNLSPEQLKIANEIANEYKKVSDMAIDNSIIKEALDNYVSRAWDFSKSSNESNFKFNTSTRHSLERSLDTILQGQAEGLNLKTEGATNNLQQLKVELGNVIENRKLVEQGFKQRYDTGRKDENGNPITQTLFSIEPRQGYVKIEHPAFKKWTYVGKAGEGTELIGNSNTKEINGSLFENRDVYAPESVAKSINNILGKSRMVGSKYFDAITNVGKTIKQSILLSPFHYVAFTKQHILTSKYTELKDINPIKAYKEGIKLMHQMTPEIEELVRDGGVTLGRQPEWTETGNESNNVVKQALDVFHKNLFETYGAGLKSFDAVNMYRHELIKNSKLDNPLPRVEVCKNVGKMINDIYGGENWNRMRGSKLQNPTLRHSLSMVMLAPDWTISNLRLFRNTFKGDEGKIYRNMWFRMAVRGAATTIALNSIMTLMDEKDENGNKLPYWEAYKRRTKIAWDMGHLKFLMVDVTPLYHAMRGSDKKQRMYISIFGANTDILKAVTNPMDFAENKMAPLPKIGLELVTNNNWQHKTFTDVDELSGIDNKGYYKRKVTKNHVTTHHAGESKGGQLKYQLTKYDYGHHHSFTPEEIPSFALSQVRGVLPSPIQAILQGATGENDWAKTLLSGSGTGFLFGK